MKFALVISLYFMIGIIWVIRDFSVPFINAPIYTRMKNNIRLIACFIIFWPRRFWQYSHKISKEEIIESSNPAALSYYNKGTILMKMGKFSEAVDALGKAIGEDPNFVVAYINRANAYSRWYPLPTNMKIKELETNALWDYSKAIELNPNNASAYHNRAAAHYIFGKYAESWQDVLKAERLGSSFDNVFLVCLQNVCPRPSETLDTVRLPPK